MTTKTRAAPTRREDTGMLPGMFMRWVGAFYQNLMEIQHRADPSVARHRHAAPHDVSDYGPRRYEILGALYQEGLSPRQAARRILSRPHDPSNVPREHPSVQSYATRPGPWKNYAGATSEGWTPEKSWARAEAAAARAEHLSRVANAPTNSDPEAHKAAETAHGEAATLFHTAFWPPPGRTGQSLPPLVSVDRADTDRAFAIGARHNQIAEQHKRARDEMIAATYRQRREAWSTLDVLIGGRPNQRIDVLDQHGGFTAVTGVTKKTIALYKGDKTAAAMRGGSTLWQPGSLLKKTTTGELVASDPRSFYQTNDDVTKALYKVPGYGPLVAVWFDNATGRRIA